MHAFHSKKLAYSPKQVASWAAHRCSSRPGLALALALAVGSRSTAIFPIRSVATFPGPALIFHKEISCDFRPTPAPPPSTADLDFSPRPSLAQLRNTCGTRRIVNQHPAPATMRYSDPGIVPVGRLSQ